MSDWIASQRHWLSVERLPDYAPDLNPIENVWGNLKSEELAELRSNTIDQVADIADGGLDRIGCDAALCFATGLKDAHDVRVGDTITSATLPAVAP